MTSVIITSGIQGCRNGIKKLKSKKLIIGLCIVIAFVIIVLCCNNTTSIEKISHQNEDDYIVVENFISDFEEGAYMNACTGVEADTDDSFAVGINYNGSHMIIRSTGGKRVITLQYDWSKAETLEVLDSVLSTLGLSKSDIKKAVKSFSKDYDKNESEVLGHIGGVQWAYYKTDSYQSLAFIEV